MGYAWWVMGNFLKVCLPSGVLEALIMVNWIRERENEEDGKRKRPEGGRHLTGNVSTSSTEADIFAKWKKHMVADV